MTTNRISIQTALSIHMKYLDKHNLPIDERWFTEFFKFLMMEGELFEYDDLSGSAGYIKMVDGNEICRMVTRRV